MGQDIFWASDTKNQKAALFADNRVYTVVDKKYLPKKNLKEKVMDYHFRTFFEIAGTLVIVMFMTAILSVLSGDSFGGGISYFVDELKQPLEVIDLILCGLVYYFYKGFSTKSPRQK